MTFQPNAADGPHHDEPEQPPESSSNQPLRRYSLGGVHLSLWRNTAENGSAYLGARIERRYRDREGNWMSSSSFGTMHLVLIREMIDRVLTETAMLGVLDIANDPLRNVL